MKYRTKILTFICFVVNFCRLNAGEQSQNSQKVLLSVSRVTNCHYTELSLNNLGKLSEEELDATIKRSLQQYQYKQIEEKKVLSPEQLDAEARKGDAIADYIVATTRQCCALLATIQMQDQERLCWSIVINQSNNAITDLVNQLNESKSAVEKLKRENESLKRQQQKIEALNTMIEDLREKNLSYIGSLLLHKIGYFALTMVILALLGSKCI